MKKTRVERGITLIALIITIVVLLILAAVAINSITKDGVIGQAENATSKYNQAVKNEGDVLQGYLNTLDTYLGKWKQNGTTITDGVNTYSVGDYVTGYWDNWDDSDNYFDQEFRWQILGTENGKLLLVFSEAVKDTTPLNVTIPDGKEGYTTGLSVIEAKCQDFLNTEYATKIRNITMNEINKLTGYNPETALFKHDVEGEVGRYGNTVSYRMGTDYVQYTTLDGTWKDANELKETVPENELNTTFIKLDGSQLGSEILTEKSNYYRYSLTDYLAGNTKLSKMLAGTSYWISDQYIYTRFGRVVYGIRRAQWADYPTCSQLRVDGSSLYMTNTTEYSTSGVTLSVKPVVVLKDTVDLEPATSQMNSITTWKIK